MPAITDKSGNTIAYLQNNIVLDAQKKEVIGLVLGNCIFGKFPYPIGKFFKNTFRNIKGEITAIVSSDANSNSDNNADNFGIIKNAWQILVNIKDHTCTWVQEQSTWSKQLLTDYLSNASSEASISV